VIDMAQLTPREREIVALLGQGIPPKLIALKFNTSARTVRAQIYAARDKVGCTSVIELAVKVAREQGATA
jgi:DNA-binding CsgD family transcriptional regulator